MKRLLTFLTLLTLFFGVGWAGTITFSELGLENGVQYSDPFDGGDFTVTFSGGDNDGKYYDTGSGIRVYTGGTMTIAAKSGNITSITITSSSTGNYMPNQDNTTLTTGSISTDGTTTTWTGSANSVGFTRKSGNNHWRIQSITVTVSSGGSNVGVPTIEFSTFIPGQTSVTATITNGTNANSSTYKIGDEGTYTSYTGPVTLDLTSFESPITVYAKSSDGNNESSEASATFTLPNLGVSITPNGYSGYDAQNVTISASDYVGTATLTYKINDGEEQVYAPFSLTEPGTYTVTAYAVDQRAGGEKISATATFTISTQASGSTATATYIFNTDQGLADLNITKPNNSSGTNISEGEYTVGQVTLTTTDGSTATRVWAGTSGQTDLRVYNGGTLTFSVPEGCTINNIEFTGLNLGRLTGTGYNNGTWVGSAEEVTLSATGTATIYTITVTYTTSQTTTTEEYYLVGDFGGQGWPLLDDYKFTAQGNGIYVLNKVLPDMDNTENFRFKIAKVVDGQRVQPDFGGGGNGDYGLNKKWNNINDIVLGNDNDHQQAFSLPDCFQANFTLNANNMTFSVDKPQLYMIGTFNSYATPNNNSVNGALEMTTDTQNGGWTITHEFTNGTEFRLYDAWHEHHGGNGAHILENLLGTWLNINNDNDNYSIFHFVLDGEYIINVKNDLSQLVATIVPENHNITCTAISDVEDGQGGYKPGGTVIAKVDGTEVTSAMAGSTVTLDINATTGYTFSSVTLNGTAIEPVGGVYSFTMPNSDAAVIANFTVNHYNITLSNDVTQGTVTGLPETAYTGQVVSFSVSPEEGYTVKSVTVTPGSVAVTENEGTYSFGMPPFDVAVTVTYKAPLQPCEIPFVETWNDTEGMGGNDETWSGISTTYPIVNDNDGWIYMRDGVYVEGFNGYGANQCIRVGDRNNTGSATTPEILVSEGGVYKMTFKAGSWDENIQIGLSATGAELYLWENQDEEPTLVETTLPIASREWGEYTIYVLATAPSMTITWSAPNASNRFFLDEVNIDVFNTIIPPEFWPDPAEYPNIPENIAIEIYSEYENGTIYYLLDPTTPPADASEIKANAESGYNGYAEVLLGAPGQHTVYAVVEVEGVLSPIASATYTTYKELEWRIVERYGDFNPFCEYIIVNSDFTKIVGSYANGHFNAVNCENNVTFDPYHRSASFNSPDVKTFSLDCEAYPYGGDYYNFYLKDAEDTYYSLGDENVVATQSQQSQIYIDFDYDNHGEIEAYYTILRGLDASISLAYDDNNGNFGIYADGSPIYIYFRAKPMTLADIVKYDMSGANVTISDELVVAKCLDYVDPDIEGIVGGAVLLCKDLGQAIDKTTNPDPENIEDYMRENHFFNGDWDQSNWIALVFNNVSQDDWATLKNYEGMHIKPGTVTGRYDSDYGVKHLLLMNTTTLEEAEDTQATTYKPNLYCAANFLSSNHNGNATGHQVEGEDYSYKKYFFMNPKVEEYCEITFAVWNPLGEDFGFFTLPKPDGKNNLTNIYGAFWVNWSYNQYGDVSLDMYNDPGQAYKFYAIVEKQHLVSKAPMLKDGETQPHVDPQDNVWPDGNYIVYPIDFKPENEENIVTGIDTVNMFSGNSQVKSVKYVNVAGIESATPFQGMNIVVIEYTNGTRTTTKMIKK